MKMQSFPFQVLDWSTLPKEQHQGTTGFAQWQVLTMNDIRIRQVEYSPGYLADHWCSKGHIIFCVSGEMITELQDGSKHELKAGMSYQVGDDCEAHRSSSIHGCKLFIVD